ncbi:hypothetical protein Sjap_015730 [Stephania japonica]|uniref:Uncharacterized protein n=1 Tax=Stephania japonica TaxID=461633 RepID=A0AAP0NRM9_9MAGN
MAESAFLKRSRDQETITSDHDQEDIMKRQRLITLLDEEFCEEEPNQDYVSSFITTLQKEINPSDHSDDANSSSSSDPLLFSDIVLEGYKIDDDCVEQELRHLFEASDDDLGIVSSSSHDDDVDCCCIDGEENVLLCGFDVGLWDFEDHESANYYSTIDTLTLL